MISNAALMLIQRAIDTRSLEAEDELIRYVAALEDAAPLLPQLQAEERVVRFLWPKKELDADCTPGDSKA